jgi:hypothetical protein
MARAEPERVSLGAVTQRAAAPCSSLSRRALTSRAASRNAGSRSAGKGRFPKITSKTAGGFVNFTNVIGLAARGSGAEGASRAYVHFIFGNEQGLYNGIPVPELNNHLGRVDY